MNNDTTEQLSALQEKIARLKVRSGKEGENVTG